MIATLRLVRAAACGAALLCAGSPVATASQTPPGFGAAPAAVAPAGPEDPLKRETPRGAFLGFISAAQAGHDSLAAEYLQWPRARLGLSREEAARQLMFALNHGFEGSIDGLSNQPDGSLADGLPPDLERAGAIVLADGDRASVLLRRVARDEGGAIWLVADDTVAEIPRLHRGSGLPDLEGRLPRALTSASFGGLPIWVPLALIVLLPLIYVAVRAMLGAGIWFVRLLAGRRGLAAVPWLWESWRALARPTAFLLTVLLYGAAGSRLGIPIYYRFLFERTVRVLVLAGLVWWLWRLQDLLLGRLRAYIDAVNPGRAQSVTAIGGRILKGVTLGIAILIGLALFGVDLSATLAGLGIGGLALAFAAQKTLENVFGGLSVLGDKSIVVGDFCQIGTHTGTVEDVGLRTTKLRTLSRTLVHVPNGSVATMAVENFSRRDKFLFRHTLTLRYETTREEMDRVLAGLREMLERDSRVDAEARRARLIRLGPYSLDVEIFAFVIAPDFAAFLAIQEELLLKTMQVVADSGTGFAFPSQTLYLARDAATSDAPPTDAVVPA